MNLGKNLILAYFKLMKKIVYCKEGYYKKISISIISEFIENYYYSY